MKSSAAAHRRARLARARWATTVGVDRWTPSEVPQIAAGYYWHPSLATGLGTAGFKLVEGNGKTSFDVPQATTTSQPTALSENSNVQYRMRKAADANPSILGLTAVAAGWTGNTYIAGWFRLPDAAGDITGSGNLFVHLPTTAGQRRISLQILINTTDRVATTTSNDGTATVGNQWLSPLTGGNWVWLELFVTIGGAVELWADFVLVAHAVTASAGTPLFDGVAPISIASRFAAALGNVDTTDFATIVYANGHPSTINRERARNWRRPVAAYQVAA